MYTVFDLHKSYNNQYYGNFYHANGALIFSTAHFADKRPLKKLIKRLALGGRVEVRDWAADKTYIQN